MSMLVLKSAPARVVSCAPPVVRALLMFAYLLVCAWPPATVAQSVDRTVGQTPHPTPTPAPMPKELPRRKVDIPPPASDSAPGGGRPRRGIVGPSVAPAQST